MKWNMGWMNDTLDFISRDPVHRSYHHHEMTFSMLYAFSENFVLPISHDEVVHGKEHAVGPDARQRPREGGRAARPARPISGPTRASSCCSWARSSASAPEWSEERGVDWYQLDENSFSTGIQRMVHDINGIYQTRRALWSRDTSPEGYSWIDANDSANNVLSFLRFGDDGSMLACVFNFSGSEHTRYRLGLPHAGTWREVLNTDADIYNGTGYRQLRRGGSHRRAVARTPRVGGDGAAAAGRAVVRTGLTAPNGRTGRNESRTSICAISSTLGDQYNAFASLRRPAMTSGSAGSNRSNSSISRVRTLVRSSPAVRLISAISRSNAAATFCCRIVDIRRGEGGLDVVGRGVGGDDRVGRAWVARCRKPI